MNYRKTLTELIQDINQFIQTDNVTYRDKDLMKLYFQLGLVQGMLETEKSKRLQRLENTPEVYIPEDEI